MHLDEADEYIEDKVVDIVQKAQEEIEQKMLDNTQTIEKLIYGSVKELDLELSSKIQDLS